MFIGRFSKQKQGKIYTECKNISYNYILHTRLTIILTSYLKLDDKGCLLFLWCSVEITRTVALSPLGQSCEVRICDGGQRRYICENAKLQRRRSDTTIASLPLQRFTLAIATSFTLLHLYI